MDRICIKRLDQFFMHHCINSSNKQGASQRTLRILPCPLGTLPRESSGHVPRPPMDSS